MIGIIVMLVFKCGPYPYKLRLGLLILFVIIIIICIICIVILATKGALCPLEYRLGLGISFGIIILVCIICIAILAKKKKGPEDRPFDLTFEMCVHRSTNSEWYRTDTDPMIPVHNDNKHSIDTVPFDTNTETSSITIKNVSWSDSASYILQAKNGSGTPAQASITITADDLVGIDVTFTLPVSGSVNPVVNWIGPNGEPLTRSGKHVIVSPDSKTGTSSLTIKNVSLTDRGSYSFQAKNGSGTQALASFTITAHDKKRKNTGSSSAVSRKDVALQMEGKVKSSDTERTPVIHTGTQNKVESNTTSTLTKSFDQNETRSQPPRGVALEPKYRPQPPPPENSDVKDRKERGLSANYDDAQGLPNETPQSRRPPARLEPIRSAVEEEVTSEETKKKKKEKKNKDKKKKNRMNEGRPEQEMAELQGLRKSSEDQVVSDAD